MTKSKYNTSAAESFLFGVVAYQTFQSDIIGEVFLVSRWDDGDVWCYVSHDDVGDYWCALDKDEAKRLGLPI